MIVACTGSREGASEAALDAFRAWLDDLDEAVEEAHHGDCLGADTQFHQIVKEQDVFVHVHPCTIRSQRSYCQGDQVHPVAPPLVRNRTMVDLADHLVAFPSTFEEVMRSGTWATIRYARKIGRPGTIFWPDGTMDRL